MYSKLHHCWATCKAHFGLHELLYQSKKTDRQGSLKLKSFHSRNFDCIAIQDFSFQKPEFVLF